MSKRRKSTCESVCETIGRLDRHQLGLGMGLAVGSANQPAMKQRLEFLDARGIDPSAMFYTELDAMDEILDRMERTTGGWQRE